MSDINVPEGMLEAAKDAYEMSGADEDVPQILKAALRWLAENPIVPTDMQLHEINAINPHPIDVATHDRFIAIEWQRRMFLAPEPEPALKDLLWKANPYPNTGAEYRHDEAVKEAYRRGQKSR